MFPGMVHAKFHNSGYIPKSPFPRNGQNMIFHSGHAIPVSNQNRFIGYQGHQVLVEKDTSLSFTLTTRRGIYIYKTSQLVSLDQLKSWSNNIWHNYIFYWSSPDNCIPWPSWVVWVYFWYSFEITSHCYQLLFCSYTNFLEENKRGIKEINEDLKTT